MEAKYIQHMGSDLTVVNSARVSFDKESEWEIIDWKPAEGRVWTPVKVLKEGDAKLIKYLASNNHWTPFSHCQITMRETVPIFVARQRFKHMVGFTYNEVSRRYVSDAPEFYTPSEWRGKPINAKQGSSDEVINIHEHYMWVDKSVSGWDDYTVGEMFEEHMERTQLLYNRMIKIGVAPEQARMVLPVSQYTSYYVTGSLAAWARAYKLRSDPHAQVEIQDLAKQWWSIISPLYPISWRALTE